jgi:putative lipoic acid-binding regulatory protein
MAGEDRARSLALLQSQHDFPGRFGVRVVGRDVQPERLQEAAQEAGAQVVSVGERASRQGTYRAFSLELWVPSAEVVLEAYASLGKVPGVLTVF